MKTWASAILAGIALALFSGCQGTAQWDITPPPTGDWPFDRFGNYHEEYSDSRHPDANLYYDTLSIGLDLHDISLRGLHAGDCGETR